MTTAVLTAVVVAVSLALATVPTRAGRTPAFTDDPEQESARAPRRSFRGRRAPTAIEPAALAEWVDDLARTLRHGSTLRESLSIVQPGDGAIGAASSSLRHDLSRGSTVVDACQRWTESLRSSRLARAELLTTTAAVVGASAALGGSAAAPLDRLAATMRQHASDDLERSAQSSQARLSARVLTFVPLAMLILLLVTDDQVRGVIVEPVGAGVVTTGLALNAAGSLWMRRIVGTHGSGGSGGSDGSGGSGCSGGSR